MTKHTAVARRQVNANQITLYIPKSEDNPGLRLIRDFLSTERAVCERVQQVARVFNKNINYLRPAFKEIDQLLPLYNNLTINIFSDIPWSETSEKTENICLWISGLRQVVASDLFKKRASLLKEAALFYYRYQAALVAYIQKHDHISIEDKKIIKNNFSEPALRISRMLVLCQEIQKYFDACQSESIDPKLQANLNALINDLKDYADSINNAISQDVVSTSTKGKRKSDLEEDKYRCIRKKGKYALASPSAAADSSTSQQHIPFEMQKEQFLTWLLPKNKQLTSSITLQGINMKLQGLSNDPIEKLMLLEAAYESIENLAHQQGKTHSIFANRYLLRVDFPFTYEQVRCINVLKSAYLQVVTETPFIANSSFENYLEHMYPSDPRSSRFGKLLAFNQTPFSLLVKQVTGSLSTLEKLKQGIGRSAISPDSSFSPGVG